MCGLLCSGLNRIDRIRIREHTLKCGPLTRVQLVQKIDDEVPDLICRVGNILTNTEIMKLCQDVLHTVIGREIHELLSCR